MSAAKGGKKKGHHRPTPDPLVSKSLAAAAELELVHFLELSIGEKTDDYLRQLALRDASTCSIVDTAMKLLVGLERLGPAAPVGIKTNSPEAGGDRPLIKGLFAAPKSALLPAQRCLNAKFAVVVGVVFSLQHRSNGGTILFQNASGDKNCAFTLSFSEIEQAFKVAPSMFYLHQVFNAEVLSVSPRTVKLQLTEKIDAN